MKSATQRSVFRIAAVTAAAIFVAACSEPVAQGAPPAAPQVSVITIEPASVPLNTELPGRTAAFLVSEVRPQVNGIVKRRLFEEGSDVTEGQVLYEIDDATYKANLDSAKAALAKAEANLKVARVTADRHKELVKIKAVSAQANDTAQAELQQAQAEVASARAALDMARINLEYTRIKAPISGRIGQSSITPGALLSANQANALTTIQQLNPVYVDVTQSSVDMLRLRRALESGLLKSSAGSKANVRLVLEDGSAYQETGELQFSDARVDPNTGMVTLRAIFPNPRYELLPGMYVRAVLEEGVRENAVLVPQRAVTRNPQGQATALVVNKDGVVELRVLQANRTVGDQWLIDDGLQAGDQVIVEGVQKVRPGAKANTTPWEAQ
ncbi:MAG: efflux RND transporter periplasmic adaptor subunit [Alcaligenaceae bacterium]|nr:efflux RND transporter periplasmic adaptor subunit [Alcaligenaceae bacterium]